MRWIESPRRLTPHSLFALSHTVFFYCYGVEHQSTCTMGHVATYHLRNRPPPRRDSSFPRPPPFSPPADPIARPTCAARGADIRARALAPGSSAAAPRDSTARRLLCGPLCRKHGADPEPRPEVPAGRGAAWWTRGGGAGAERERDGWRPLHARREQAGGEHERGAEQPHDRHASGLRAGPWTRHGRVTLSRRRLDSSCAG